MNILPKSVLSSNSFLCTRTKQHQASASNVLPIVLLVRLFAVALIFCAFTAPTRAAFPDDFNGVVWIDPETEPGVVAGWPATATLTTPFHPTTLYVNSTKSGVWPNKRVNNVVVNASLWVFARFDGVWHATTFEYLRPNTSTKPLSVVEGGHAKRPPFKTSGYIWRPNNREVIGFMVSGIARFNLVNNNIRERSNVALYKWGVGPVDEMDDEGIGEPEPEPEPEPEKCVEPEPVINTHRYTGTVTALATVTTPESTIPFQETESVVIDVSDDRTLTMTVDGEVMTTQVNQDGSFVGAYNIDIPFLSNCDVTVNVTGQLDRQDITGYGQGSESCPPYSATLNATFSASSPTEPSFLDLRPPAPKECVVTTAPLMLLLD